MTIVSTDSPETTVSKPAWPVLITLAGATLLASLGISIASVALPTLAHAFSAAIPEIQWVVLAYLTTVTAAIVPAGWFGDLFSSRHVLIAGFAVFAAASALCAFAPTLSVLIAGRTLQGAGGAILMALPIAIARQVVAKERLGSAMGLLGTMSAIGTALGPSAGGILIAGYGWRSVFVLLAGIAALLIAFAVVTIPASPGRRQSGRTPLDWPGAGFLGAALLAYAAAMSGWNSGLVLPLTIAALTTFIVVEHRSQAPMIPLQMLFGRAISPALAMNVLVATVMMTTLVVGPFFLSIALGLDVASTGMVMAVGPVVSAISGVPAGRATDRFGAHRTVAAGLFVILVGLVMLAALPRLFGVAGYVAALAFLTPGFQLFLAANNTAVMMDAPDARRGTMSALLGLSRNLGFMTGASAMAAVFGLAAGTGEAGNLTTDHTADAFTITFLVAAGLAASALVLAAIGQGARKR